MASDMLSGLGIASLLLAFVHSTIYVAEVGTRADVDRLVRHVDTVSGICSAHLLVRRHFVSSLFFGVSIEVDGNDVRDCISALPGVQAVWRTSHLKLAAEELPPREVLDSTKGLDSPLDGGLFHEMTGVSELHRRGVNGRGVTIAIIDEGVDYLHPAFGSGIGPGHTIRSSLDFVHDRSRGIPVPMNVLTECTEHGTHVTGICVGNHTATGFVGVATGADVVHYRVSGCDRIPLESDIIAEALLYAHAQQVDIISASLTTNHGPYHDDVVSEILSRIIAEDRTICVVAAGNYGWKGPFSGAAPASTEGALTVGSVNAQHVVSFSPRARYYIYYNGSEHSTGTFLWKPAPLTRFPDSLNVCALTTDTTVPDDACHTIRGPIDLDRCVVLVRRGGCLFDVKMRNLVAAGAQYALIYDNSTLMNAFPLFTFQNLFPGILGAGSVAAAVGRSFLQFLSDGYTISVEMDSNFTLRPSLQLGENSAPHGLVNARGSQGPTGSLGILTSVLAPGGNIWSTFPRTWGGYGTLSGTSMAAPYVAGAAALLRQSLPGLPTSRIVKRMTSTATPLRFNDGTPNSYYSLAPVIQQGSGLLNTLAAVDVQTEVSPSTILLNDTRYFTAARELRITNHGAFSKAYHVSVVPALTVKSMAPDGHVIPWTHNNQSAIASTEYLEQLLPDVFANVSIDPQTFTLTPKSSQKLTLSFDIKPLADWYDTCPLYSGYVTIDVVSGSERLVVPYSGVACPMASVSALPSHWNRTYLTAMSYAQSEGEKFETVPIDAQISTFVLPCRDGMLDYVERNNITLPTVNLELAMFSHNVEVYACGEMLNATGNCQAIAFANEAARPGGYSRVTTTYMPWAGQWRDGTWATAGYYYFMVCAARTWGQKADCSVLGQIRLQCMV